MCSCFLFPKHIQYLNDILETPMTTSGHCIYILRRYIYFFGHRWKKIRRIFLKKSRLYFCPRDGQTWRQGTPDIVYASARSEIPRMLRCLAHNFIGFLFFCPIPLHRILDKKKEKEKQNYQMGDNRRVLNGVKIIMYETGACGHKNSQICQCFFNSKTGRFRRTCVWRLCYSVCTFSIIEFS